MGMNGVANHCCCGLKVKLSYKGFKRWLTILDKGTPFVFSREVRGYQKEVKKKDYIKLLCSWLDVDGIDELEQYLDDNFELITDKLVSFVSKYLKNKIILVADVHADRDYALRQEGHLDVVKYLVKKG